ncbi:MAG TPA: flagellar protein FlbB [Xanthobacteraceae bacterium]|nr:flagellar protein FlbB [Xanthobacteraceae bacterium]
MTRFIRDVRLLPVVLFAATCLFALKTIGIFAEGGFTLNETGAAASDAQRSVDETAKTLIAAGEPKNSWAKEMFNYPDGRTPSAAPQPASKATTAAASIADPDITGSVGGGAEKKPEAAAKPGAKAVNPPKDPGGTVIPIDENRPVSPAERAILERLQERRQELEARAKEIDTRDGLVRAAEKQLEARLAELKALEARINNTIAGRQGADAKRFKDLVAMYANMKPKDAAKIFDRLDLDILVQVSSQIDPRTMSAILGQMSPEAAERLTVELAKRAIPGSDKAPVAADLPKIQGKPGG